uniref:Deubiquitinating enzyme A n=1 Tax=Rhabditophanes sp. KR3021 TaxID=114890 RepID=A0AC35THK0_9BILA
MENNSVPKDNDEQESGVVPDPGPEAIKTMATIFKAVSIEIDDTQLREEEAQCIVTRPPKRAWNEEWESQSFEPAIMRRHSSISSLAVGMDEEEYEYGGDVQYECESDLGFDKEDSFSEIDESEFPDLPHKEGNLNSEDEMDTDISFNSNLEDQFRKLLVTANMFIIKIIGDGSCMFRAISHQLFGDEDSHLQLRRACIEYLHQNKSYYCNFVTQDFNAYLARKMCPFVFGNHMEINALAAILGRPIEVYEYTLKPSTLITPERLYSTAPLRVSYHQQFHYNSLCVMECPYVTNALHVPELDPETLNKHVTVSPLPLFFNIREVINTKWLTELNAGTPLADSEEKFTDTEYLTTLIKLRQHMSWEDYHAFEAMTNKKLRDENLANEAVQIMANNHRLAEEATLMEVATEEAKKAEFLYRPDAVNELIMGFELKCCMGEEIATDIFNVKFNCYYCMELERVLDFWAIDRSVDVDMLDMFIGGIVKNELRNSSEEPSFEGQEETTIAFEEVGENDMSPDSGEEAKSVEESMELGASSEDGCAGNEEGSVKKRFSKKWKMVMAQQAFHKKFFSTDNLRRY